MDQEIINDISESMLNPEGMMAFVFRLIINILVVGGIIQFFYYPKSKRSDYYFTFTIIALSTFMMVALLGTSKVKSGFALGLFAIFSIIRYRTESMPVREMTYLFAIIAISSINALAGHAIGWLGMVMINGIFILGIAAAEMIRKMPHLACKFVKYDRIDLIVPAKRAQLLQDLETRLGLKVDHVDVGTVNLLKDMVLLKVYYKPEDGNEENTVDEMSKIPNF